MQETQIDEAKAKTMKEPFVEMYQILLSLWKHDLTPAIKYAYHHINQLNTTYYNNII